ncbi:hypothetical protein WISP_35531 [Willisornis vidua]|uniref:Uncharacterized protein n=1 Tax=Willisornis vidua TaxID=1566151 RepID=A0ABQ9DN54_9PASS|nr:hypothetical protein WISP_35531 [Willisornis vidua]
MGDTFVVTLSSPLNHEEALKKAKAARDEDGHAENFPQQHYAKETPRLAFKNNCELLFAATVSCTVAYAVIQADDCAKPVTAIGEAAVGFRDFGLGTESCQKGGYGPGTKIWRKAIVAVN